MFPPNVTPKVDIHTTLRELVAHGVGLELTTSYQGVTLSHQISKIVIETDCAHFNSPSQICSLEPGQMVYFHHQSLPMSVVATISSVDWV
jgi:hypothetical protein